MIIMRKFVTIVCATAAIAANAQEIETKPFSKTYIDVPARVRFVKGNEYSVRVNTNDKEMASNIQCTLKDGVLSFEYKDLNAKNNTEVEPGKSVFDAKSGSYFYGIDMMDNLLHGGKVSPLWLGLSGEDMDQRIAMARAIGIYFGDEA